MDQLVESLVKKLTDVQEEASRRERERMQWVFDSLEEAMEQLGGTPDDDDDDEPAEKDEQGSQLDQLKTLWGKLEGWCDQLPVLGFNSAR